MRWWPKWLTVKRPPNGQAAARVERVAKEKLRQVPAREREVNRAVRSFAAEVERAMRGAR